MRLIRLTRLAGPAAAGLLAASTAGAQGLCERDLVVAESTLRRAIERLTEAGGGEEARCAAWREHARALRQVAATYGRCLKEPERGQRTAPLAARAAEFEGLARQRCR